MIRADRLKSKSGLSTLLRTNDIGLPRTFEFSLEAETIQDRVRRPRRNENHHVCSNVGINGGSAVDPGFVEFLVQPMEMLAVSSSTV